MWKSRVRTGQPWSRSICIYVHTYIPFGACKSVSSFAFLWLLWGDEFSCELRVRKTKSAYFSREAQMKKNVQDRFFSWFYFYPSCPNKDYRFPTHQPPPALAKSTILWSRNGGKCIFAFGKICDIQIFRDLRKLDDSGTLLPCLWMMTGRKTKLLKKQRAVVMHTLVGFSQVVCYSVTFVWGTECSTWYLVWRRSLPSCSHGYCPVHAHGPFVPNLGWA